MADDVLTIVEGRVGRLRVNRPKAIHALTTDMCRTMIDALTAWKDDAGVIAVLIDHADGRGFCAGGDIRMVAESAAGDGVAAREFFRTEYQLNHFLFMYPKPIVAFMDGVTMGGGVGIAQPARYRVATDRTIYAMPETGIGLFPDVGGGWYLSRLPGRVGRYLAVTGARIDGGDACALGLATHFVPSERLDALKAEIARDPSAIENLLSGVSETPPPSALAAMSDTIDRLFASDRLEDIFAALRAEGGGWASEQVALMETKSPQTMKVALRQLATASALTDFSDNMAMEFGLACRVIERPDFLEGVRAVIVDKDNRPHWTPATPEEVSDALIEALFAPLPGADAWRPLPQSGARG
jgi:enoyl-CoA hydratase